MAKEFVNVALLGLGTVGTGVVKVLEENAQNIQQKVGLPIRVTKVLVRDISKKRKVDLQPEQLTTNIDDILNNPEIDIVVELMGGEEPALGYMIEALHKGKQVVTANKELIAKYGKQIFDAASSTGSDILFEASVCGGIPIIRPLKQCLAGNKIEEIMGIVNGTTNYILTKMTKEGAEFYDALKEAQEKGYAEADPAADIDGHDAVRKIAILGSIAFNTRIDLDQIYFEGIRKIEQVDIQYARELGYVIKLLAIAREDDGEIEVRVHPVFLPNTHPLAAVSNVYNAVFIKGNAVGETMFYGKGAGELPTASAVVGDIIDAARDLTHNTKSRIGCTCFESKKLKSPEEIVSKYYVRVQVCDQPGVLASIADAFGKNQVSLKSVIQTKAHGEKAEVVVITHDIKEKNIKDSVKHLEKLPVVDKISNVIRVEGKEL